jgi:transposase
MKIVGCDLHARQQSIAMVDTETGEFTEKLLKHEGNAVRDVYTSLQGPVVVGIEATGAMQWFLQLLEELGIACRVGHPAKIRAAETRKQKHDRRDAEVILDLLMMKDRYPDIWMPSTEQRDLRTLLRDRHQWVKMRARLQHRLQAIALNHALREGRALWTAAGRRALQGLALPPYSAQRRDELLSLYTIRKADPATGQAGGERSPTKATRTPAAHSSRRGSGHCIGDRSVSGRPHSLRNRQSGGQLYRDDPVRAQQRQEAATGEADQRRQFTASLPVDRSHAARCSQGRRTKTLLSAQAHPERNGQGEGCGGAQAGDSFVDHAALRPPEMFAAVATFAEFIPGPFAAKAMPHKNCDDWRDHV